MNTTGYSSSSEQLGVAHILIKGILLFTVINIMFAFLNPPIGKLSAYNSLFPGRERLPFALDNPQSAYNVSLTDLDAMFASHVISGKKSSSEYRVVFLGASPLWGVTLSSADTLTGQINARHALTCDGRQIRTYNLGYPRSSVTKDLLILSVAMQYEPDMVVWLVSLADLIPDRRMDHPLIAANKPQIERLVSVYGADIYLDSIVFPKETWWDLTIVGKRYNFADLARLQLYGVLWAATGIDYYYPPTPEQRDTTLPGDITYGGRRPPQNIEDLLSFDILDTGARVVGDAKFILVNEPILILNGVENSDLFYNSSYPRWAYDQYRKFLLTRSLKNGWVYLDLWNSLPLDLFSTDANLHPTAVGEAELAEMILSLVLIQACP